MVMACSGTKLGAGEDSYVKVALPECSRKIFLCCLPIVLIFFMQRNTAQ